MQFLAITFMKTYHFLDAYLYGVDKRNPFAALSAARSQLEVSGFSPLSPTFSPTRIPEEPR